MKKHTRATPAGTPRGRASKPRSQRPRGRIPTFSEFVRASGKPGFKPNPRQKYGSHRRGPESRVWRRQYEVLALTDRPVWSLARMFRNFPA